MAVMKVLAATAAVAVAHHPHDSIWTMSAAPGGNVAVETRFGTLVSTDDGVSFKHTRDTQLPSAIAMSPKYATDSLMYAYSRSRQFCVSADGGFAWDCLFPSCTHSQWSPAQGGGAFVGMTSTGAVLTVDSQFRVMRSTDGGPFAEVTALSLSECPAIGVSPDDVVYLMTSDTLYISASSGAHWHTRPLDRTAIGEGVAIKRVAPVGFLLSFVLTVDDRVFYLDHRDPAGPVEVVVPASETLVVEGGSNDIIQIAARRVSGLPTLFVVRDNTQTFQLTRDLGATWEVKGAPNEITDNNGPGAHEFNELEITDVVPMPFSPRVWLGTYVGLYYSDDDGDTWTYLDTLTASIFGMDVVALDDNPGSYRVSVHTYNSGIFAGTANVTSPTTFSTDIEQLPPLGDWRTNGLRQAYRLNAQSPNYATDSAMIRVTNNFHERLERSTDDFVDDIQQMTYVIIDPEERTGIQQLEWIKTAAWDRIYMCGWNVGVQVSENGGLTWQLYWDPAWGRNGLLADAVVLQMGFSPTFETDGIMVAMLDLDARLTNSDGNGNVAFYVSRAYGRGWGTVRIPETPTWSTFALVKGTVDPILVCTHYSSRSSSAYAVKLDDYASFRELTEVSSPLKPFGLAYRDSIAASPDGSELAFLYIDGGVLFGEIDPDTLLFSPLRGSQPTDHEMINFWQHTNIRRAPFRKYNGVIIYSPNYADDGTIFAKDFYSILISTDQGQTFQNLHTLPHNPPAAP